MKIKFLLLIILPLFLIHLTTFCKKAEDYPDNIPDFVKRDIRECKKNNECCDSNTQLIIEEWKSNIDNDLLYYYKYNYFNQSLFDSSGHLLYHGSHPICCPQEYIYNRTIFIMNGEFIYLYKNVN